jgi:hypothetical protein
MNRHMCGRSNSNCAKEHQRQLIEQRSFYELTLNASVVELGQPLPPKSHLAAEVVSA